MAARASFGLNRAFWPSAAGIDTDHSRFVIILTEPRDGVLSALRAALDSLGHFAEGAAAESPSVADHVRARGLEVGRNVFVNLLLRN